VALIKRENAASRRAFERAGFRSEGEVEAKGFACVRMMMKNPLAGHSRQTDIAMSQTASPSSAPAADPSVWEGQIYAQGQQLNKYPFDNVVSFIFRHRPRGKTPGETRILELGCGTGNNLWFAAREGFSVCGIDFSKSAITFARERFAREGLPGEFIEGDFREIPSADNSFDLAFDRGGLTCAGFSVAREILGVVRRKLRDGGRFLFNPYSQRHTGYSHGESGPDRLTRNMKQGRLTHVGDICFYSAEMVREITAEGWKTIHIEHVEVRESFPTDGDTHAEWRVILEKA